MQPLKDFQTRGQDLDFFRPPCSQEAEEDKDRNKKVQVPKEPLQPLKDFQTRGQDLDFFVRPVARKKRRSQHGERERERERERESKRERERMKSPGPRGSPATP